MSKEDYFKYYIQGSDHYLIPKDVFIELFNEMVNWREETKELKKQLEEYKLQNINLRADIMIKKMALPNELIKDKTFYDLYDMPTYEELLAQQKEFIKYLEDEIKFYKNKDSYMVVHIHGSYDLNDIELKLLEEILQKYKSIIGVSDEKK